MKKRKDEAVEEAKLALQEYESSLKELEDTGVKETVAGVASGRMVFGAAKKNIPVPEPSNKVQTDNYYQHSESEDEQDEFADARNKLKNNSLKDGNVDSGFLNDDATVRHNSVFEVIIASLFKVQNFFQV